MQVELELPEGVVTLVSGKQRTEMGHLERRSNKLSTAYYATSPTDNRAHAERVLQTSSGTTINLEVKSDRPGLPYQKIQL